MAAANYMLKKAFKEVTRDIYKKDAELRMKAARHVKKKVKAKISDEYFAGHHSQEGELSGKITGNLLAGLTVKSGPLFSMVGFKAPAYHANILEFGAPNRVTKSGTPNPMGKRPFLFATFAEEAGTVKRILSEERI